MFVDIELKFQPQYKLLVLKQNSYFKVNKRLSSTRWTALSYFTNMGDIQAECSRNIK